MKPFIENPGPSGRGRFIIMLVAIVVAGILLAACQRGSDGPGSAGDGSLTIGLTDAPGDLATYGVDLLSLKLTRADGATIEALPLQTRIDFAQYVDMTEFLTVATVPAGRYVEAKLVLDYAQADIRVEDETGGIRTVDRIVDADGNAVTRLETSVRLDGTDALVVVPGGPAHMTIDFDLAASHRVDFDPITGGATLVVEPFVVADIQLDAPKPHRLRGALDEVDPARDRFTTIVRPFRHALGEHRRRFGAVEVFVDDHTTYEIDQVSYTGQAGLERLAELPRYAATIVVGDLVAGTRRFEATEVHAGSSVPGGTQDALAGTVVARLGDRLTVAGAVLTRRDGTVAFNERVEVVVASTTRVRRQFSVQSSSIDAISVGQRVRVFGSLSDSSSAPVLDASQGYVRLLMSRLMARVVGTVSIPEQTPPFVVDVQRIDGRPVGLFDFSGTGATPADDADPHHYEIDGTRLPSLALADGVPVEVRGFVRPFGMAPLDFEARSVVDLSGVGARIAVDWAPATTAAFKRLASDVIVLDLAGAGRFHHVARKRIRTDLSSLGIDTSIVPAADGRGAFWIRRPGGTRRYARFADFVAALEAGLDAGLRVRGLKGRGHYQDGLSVLTADRLIVGLVL